MCKVPQSSKEQAEFLARWATKMAAVDHDRLAREMALRTVNREALGRRNRAKAYLDHRKPPS